MSTYTDLRNRIKEPVVVNYNDRVTLQAISALNPNNEFHGKFSGTFVGEKHVTGETLSAVTVSDSLLSGAYIKLGDGIVPLESMAEDVLQSKASAIVRGGTISARHVGYDSVMDLFKELYDVSFQIKANSVYGICIDRTVSALSSASYVTVGDRHLREDDVIFVKNNVCVGAMRENDLLITDMFGYVRKSDISAVYAKIDEVLPGEYDETATYEVSAVAKALFGIKDALSAFIS